MICPNPNCKATIPDGSTFCPDCGTPIKDGAAIRAAAREIVSHSEEGFMALIAHNELAHFVDKTPIEYCEEIIAKKASIDKYARNAKRRHEENLSIEKMVEEGIAYYNEGYYDSALQLWHEAAELGNAEALYRIGICQEKGQGVPEDAEAAIKSNRKAAEQGFAEAQNVLGNCYANGKGVEADKNEAAKWYRKAAEQEFDEAQCNLAACYEQGNGVKKDDTEAFRWYRKAAEHGNAKAQNAIGDSYLLGKGVEKDEQEAVKWYRKAAEQDYTEALCNLGKCYKDGKGVPQDGDAALELYRKASEIGSGKASFILGKHYKEEDCFMALKWYDKAEKQGNSLAHEAKETLLNEKAKEVGLGKPLILIAGVNFIVCCFVLGLLFMGVIQFFEDNHWDMIFEDELTNKLFALGILAIVAIITIYLIYSFIAYKRRVKEYKSEHPDDPINEYL